MSTRSLYDEHAGRWQRSTPSSLSDFTGRPAVFELCGDVSGLRVIDLGCGEGYCSRVLHEAGAASICGIDISPEMVALAQKQPLDGVSYATGDVTALEFDDGQFDLALGMFVFNYTTLAQTRAALAEAHRVLKPGGHLVFAVPHPSLAWMRAELQPPFYFDMRGQGYFSGRDHEAHGEIYRIDGQALPVRMIHKTVEDYFRLLREAGFDSLPELRELSVRPADLEKNPAFFGPVADTPLHLAIRIEKSPAS